ncbi:energy transducer TonB [Gracilimonas tropica]|uniref:energy transducer TonB n=1 Tax=Gracilimonas tropica TaxID=454600 RepID=UPI00035F28C8|nr:energy transducer TonB [Gracilimonas tropica]
MSLKNPSADLRLNYPILLETGIIIALLVLIFCMKIDLPTVNTSSVLYVEGDETALVLPPSVVENTSLIKPPPRPQVPVYLPNDTPIEPEPIEIDEFDRISRLMIPPLPDQIIVEPTYDLFKDIEQLPELIGGEQAFQNSIEYPLLARRARVQGIVEVEFTVSETGKVLDPVIIKGLGYGCDKAVLDAIKLQRYRPGKKAGKVSSFRIKETVQFILLNT